MKISVSQSSIWKKYLSEREFYRHIRACGFECIDYDFYDYLGDDSSVYLGEKGLDEARSMRDYLDSLGIKPLQAHAPKGEPAIDTEGISRRTLRAIECGGIMGVKHMVYHPGGLPGMSRREYLDFNVKYVQKLLPALEKTGINLLLENVGRWDEPFYDRTADEMLELINAVNHPLYHACLDTGHLSLQDANQYETIIALGDHLLALHVQDNYGSLPVPSLNKPWRQDLHLPPLMGCVNFDEVLTALKQIGFKGTFNLEPEAPRAYDKANKYAKEPKLRTVPLELVDEFYSWAYDIAHYMLAEYGLAED